MSTTNSNHKLSTLSICFGQGWGTRERSALRDAINLRKRYKNVAILCNRDTRIDLEAKKSGIQCYYMRRSSPGTFLKVKFYLEYCSFFKKFKFDIVHCYGMDDLGAIAFSLRRFPLTALFVSFFQEFKQAYSNLRHRLALSRVDRIFVSSDELYENVIDCLPVAAKNIEMIGLGVELKKEFPNNAENPFEKYQCSQDHLLGVLVDSDLKEVDSLLPLLNILPPLNNNEQTDKIKKTVKLVLLAHRDWNEILIFKELKNQVWGLGIEEYVLFYHEDEVERLYRFFDLWISVDSEDCLEDHVMMAISEGVPVALPRNASTAEFLRNVVGVGETYKSGDSRDLRGQVVKMLGDLKLYRGAALSNFQDLNLVQGQNKYNTSVFGQYEKSTSKRRRFFLRNT